MMTTHSSGAYRESVDMLMINVLVLGAVQGVVPGAVQCTASGGKRMPASRCTVVRGESESGDALWSRVIETIRALKEPRERLVHVLVDCLYGAQPSEATIGKSDEYFNLRVSLWRRYYLEKNDVKRVRVACRIADLVFAQSSTPTRRL